MRFTLIDRICDIQTGVSITAVKAVSLAEEYLEDHFPRFPVMPGVLMLESMYQASALLLHRTEGFCHSTILLKEAYNVKYAGFVQPGQTLVVHSKLVSLDDRNATFQAKGKVGRQTAVSGKLVLERFNVADRDPDRKAWDGYARQQIRRWFDGLHQPT